MFNIKEMVKGKKVKFVHYCLGEMVYQTECGFQFPVPTSDTGNGFFLAEDKAITFMRWIRKEVNRIETEQKQIAEWKKEAMA